MLKKSLILTAIITSLSSSIFAAEVSFPTGQTQGSFHCTASDTSAKIKIYTRFQSQELNQNHLFACEESPLKRKR